MSGDLKLDIFVFGLMLIPILIQYVPAISRLLLGSGKQNYFSVLSFTPAVYIIFLSGLGNNLLGQMIVSLSYVVFFC